MGEGEKGEVDKLALAVEAAKRKRESADDVKRKAVEWLLAKEEANCLRAARDGTQKAYDDAVAEASALAKGLIVALNTEDRIRTHRIFLPSGPNVDATIVEVTTGSATPSVRAHAVDFVAGD